MPFPPSSAASDRHGPPPPLLPSPSLVSSCLTASSPSDSVCFCLSPHGSSLSESLLQASSPHSGLPVFPSAGYAQPLLPQFGLVTHSGPSVLADDSSSPSYVGAAPSVPAATSCPAASVLSSPVSDASSRAPASAPGSSSRSRLSAGSPPFSAARPVTKLDASRASSCASAPRSPPASSRPPLASGSSAGVPGLPAASLFLLYTRPEELRQLLLDPARSLPQSQPAPAPRGSQATGAKDQDAAPGARAPEACPATEALGSDVSGKGAEGCGRREGCAAEEGTASALESTYCRSSVTEAPSSGPAAEETPAPCSDGAPDAKAAGSPSHAAPSDCRSSDCTASTSAASPPSAGAPPPPSEPSTAPACGTAPNTDACAPFCAAGRGDARGPPSDSQPPAAVPPSPASTEELQCSCVILLSRWTRYSDVVNEFGPQASVSSVRPLSAAGSSPPGTSRTARRPKDAKRASPVHRKAVYGEARVCEGAARATSQSAQATPHHLGLLMQHVDQLCPAEFLLLARRVKQRLPSAIRAVLDEGEGPGGDSVHCASDEGFAIDIADKAAAHELLDDRHCSLLFGGRSAAGDNGAEKRESGLVADKDELRDGGPSSLAGDEGGRSPSSDFSAPRSFPSDLEQSSPSPLSPPACADGGWQPTPLVTGTSQVSEDRQEGDERAGEEEGEGGHQRGPQSRLLFSLAETHGFPLPQSPSNEPAPEDSLPGAMQELEQQLVDLQLRTEISAAPAAVPGGSGDRLQRPSRGLNPHAAEFRSRRTAYFSAGFSPEHAAPSFAGSCALLPNSSPGFLPRPVPPTFPATPIQFPRLPSAQTRYASVPTSSGAAQAAAPAERGSSLPGGSSSASQAQSGGIAAYRRDLERPGGGQKAALLSRLAPEAPIIGNGQTQFLPSPPQYGAGWTADQPDGFVPGGFHTEKGRVREGDQRQRDEDSAEADEAELMKALGLPTQFISSRYTARHRRAHDKRDFDVSCAAAEYAGFSSYDATYACFTGAAWPPGAPAGMDAQFYSGAHCGGAPGALQACQWPCVEAHNGAEDVVRTRTCGCGVMSDVWRPAEQVSEGDQARQANGSLEGPRSQSLPHESAECSLVSTYDHVGNRTDSSYYRLRYSLFHRYDDGTLLDENAWFETTQECIAAYLASRLRDVALHARQQSAQTRDHPASRRNQQPAVDETSRRQARGTSALSGEQVAALEEAAKPFCLPHSPRDGSDAGEKRSENQTCEPASGHRAATTLGATPVRDASGAVVCSAGSSLETSSVGAGHRTPGKTQGEGVLGKGSQGTECPYRKAPAGSALSSPRPLVAMDGCCGAGGNVIQFAQFFDACIGVDCDLLKVAICKHNASVYGVRDRVYVHHNTLAGWLRARREARRAGQLADVSSRGPKQPPDGKPDGAASARGLKEAEDDDSSLCFCCREFSRVWCRFCSAQREARHSGSGGPPVTAEEGEESHCLPPERSGVVQAVQRGLQGLAAARPLTHGSSLVADISWCFMSPPWSGPNYSGRRTFHSQLFSLAGGQDGGGGVGSAHIPSLVKAASRIAPNVCLFLPRSTNVHELAALAAALGFPLLEIEVLYSHFVDRQASQQQAPTLFPKVVIAYLVRDVASWISTRGLPGEIPAASCVSPHKSEESPTRQSRNARTARHCGGRSPASSRDCTKATCRTPFAGPTRIVFQSRRQPEASVPAYAWIPLEPPSVLLSQAKEEASPGLSVHRADCRHGPHSTTRNEGGNSKKEKASRTPNSKGNSQSTGAAQGSPRHASGAEEPVFGFWLATVGAIHALLARRPLESDVQEKNARESPSNAAEHVYNQETSRAGDENDAGDTESGTDKLATAGAPHGQTRTGKKPCAQQLASEDKRDRHDEVVTAQPSREVARDFVSDAGEGVAEKPYDAGGGEGQTADERRESVDALTAMASRLQDGTLGLDELLAAAAKVEEGPQIGTGNEQKWNQLLRLLAV
ncbi:hypothetical protein BESB_011950 [Besnoitia besnoiti]|uniref:Trimethylguanosine synthase n=1 Tax=Besnoitia besnoiti TaxID=94643 RepID=A0A2A9MA73_BESBE|nr:hypothetical protein BESB_011950 [Besnoitia besnoiti]PFH32583.1 hypothetical protein BESB_011950 [Besnoitia besnoiti]